MSPVMSKQLGEFLQEQQEPFILEVYLIERGYPTTTRRFPYPEYESDYSSSNVGKLLKRSVSSGLKGNRRFIPNCSKFVRALFGRILTVSDNQKVNSSGIREKSFSVSSETESCSKEIADDDKFSSASSATIFNSCSESDGEDACHSSTKDEHILRNKEVGADQRFRQKNDKDSRQFSPVSVLEDTNVVDDASPFHKKNDDARKRQKQFSTSVCAYKSAKPFGKSDASSQFSRNKKTVQQSKQLLFDCLREVVKNEKESPDQQSQQILGPEELWELICDNIWLWSKESINETNITDLLHFDAAASAQEWSKFEQQREQIGVQIANAILEDIRDEIITDITNLHESL